MTTLCKCGHAKSQHEANKGPCDYCGHSCKCEKYRRSDGNPDHDDPRGTFTFDSVEGFIFKD